MRIARRLFPGIVALLVVLAALSSAGAAQSQSPLLQELPQSDNTVTRIQIHEDGSATWTLEVRTRLDDQSQVESYRSFQETFRTNRTRYLDLYRARITGVVADARNVTGRDMGTTDFQASTRIQELPQRWGIVSFQFTWTHFAATNDDQLVVGDVFQHGFFIGDQDTLEIRAPPDYQVVSVDPSPASQEEGVLTWSGRQYFADDRPQVVVAPADTATGSATNGAGSGTTLLVGLVVVLSVALAGGAFYLRNRDSAGRDRTGGAPAVGGDEPDDGHEGGDATTQSPPTPSIDPIDLLTDDDRIVNILEAHGGRMRQTDIVAETEWSKAKVSRTLSDMEEAGRISKLRLGRENVIDLVDEE